MTFHNAGPISRFRDGAGRAVELDGRVIAVFRRGDEWLALDDSCPHMGASLAMGRWNGDSVECEWHHWRFDAMTGRSRARDWACVAIHATRIEEGELWIELPPRPEPSDEVEQETWFRVDAEGRVSGSAGGGGAVEGGVEVDDEGSDPVGG